VEIYEELNMSMSSNMSGDDNLIIDISREYCNAPESPHSTYRSYSPRSGPASGLGLKSVNSPEFPFSPYSPRSRPSSGEGHVNPISPAFLSSLYSPRRVSANGQGHTSLHSPESPFSPYSPRSGPENGADLTNNVMMEEVAHPEIRTNLAVGSNNMANFQERTNFNVNKQLFLSKSPEELNCPHFQFSKSSPRNYISPSQEVFPNTRIAKNDTNNLAVSENVRDSFERINTLDYQNFNINTPPEDLSYPCSQSSSSISTGYMTKCGQVVTNDLFSKGMHTDFCVGMEFTPKSTSGRSKGRQFKVSEKPNCTFGRSEGINLKVSKQLTGNDSTLPINQSSRKSRVKASGRRLIKLNLKFSIDEILKPDFGKRAIEHYGGCSNRKRMKVEANSAYYDDDRTLARSRTTPTKPLSFEGNFYKNVTKI